MQEQGSQLLLPKCVQGEWEAAAFPNGWVHEVLEKTHNATAIFPVTFLP